MFKITGELPITRADQVDRGEDWAYLKSSGQLDPFAIGSVLFNNIDPAASEADRTSLARSIAERLVSQEPPLPSHQANRLVAGVTEYMGMLTDYTQPEFRALGKA